METMSSTTSEAPDLGLSSSAAAARPPADADAAEYQWLSITTAALQDMQECVVFMGGYTLVTAKGVWWLAAAWLGLPAALAPRLQHFYRTHLLSTEDVTSIQIPRRDRSTMLRLVELLRPRA